MGRRARGLTIAAVTVGGALGLVVVLALVWGWACARTTAVSYLHMSGDPDDLYR